jgi:hypothetical protein
LSANGARVLIIGAGDVGLKIAKGLGLAETSALRHLILADLHCDHLVEPAAFLADCTGVGITIERVDGRDQAQVEALLKRARADLIVQTAALIGPWATLGKKDPVAEALAKAGLGVQLPAQLPVLLTVMSAVRALGLATPVANLSLPDIAHPILLTQGLAPTIGLGNASICQLRVRSALRTELDAQGREDEGLPLIRVLAHHHHVYGVMQGQAPSNAADGVQVFIGEAGERRDELAYRGRSIPPGPIYNVITAASVIPVLQALLPGAAALRFSAPAPLGMAGGYPLRIAPEAVTLDLPEGVDLAKAQALHQRMGAADGIAGIEGDGTVRFTAAATAALAKLEPRLTGPLALADLSSRFELLREVVSRIEA